MLMQYAKQFFLLFLFFSFQVVLAQMNEEAIKKTLKADLIINDSINQDGVFKARNSVTKKWRMYQLDYNSAKPKVVVPWYFDDIDFYQFNGSFTIAKKANAYTVISSPWREEIKTIVPFRVYNKIEHIKGSSQILACKKGDFWGYINGVDGTVLIPFVFNLKTDLPSPTQIMIKNPMAELPEKIVSILNSPLDTMSLDLSKQNLTFLPSKIKDFKNLKSLDLSGNELQILPDWLFDMENLETLDIGDNPDILTFSSAFNKLKKLKRLTIGFGRYYSYQEYIFEKGFLPETLEKLIITGYFTDEDFPEFIYRLQHLETLVLKTNTVNETMNKVNLSKLACKNNLKKLTLGYIDDVSTINSSLKSLTALEELSLFVHHKQGPLDGILETPKIRSLYFTDYSEAFKKTKGWFEINTIIDTTTNLNTMTIEEKQNVLQKWNAFYEKITIIK